MVLGPTILIPIGFEQVTQMPLFVWKSLGIPPILAGLLKRSPFCNHLKRGFFNTKMNLGKPALQVAMFRCMLFFMHPDPCLEPQERFKSGPSARSWRLPIFGPWKLQAAVGAKPGGDGIQAAAKTAGSDASGEWSGPVRGVGASRRA